jgi:integrase
LAAEEAEVITLARDRTKTGVAHIIPLSEPAVQILRGLHRIHGSKLVFTSTGSTRVSGFARAKDRLDRTSDVRDWRTHDLRRTVATGLQKLGTRLEITEAVLGHTSGSRAGIISVYQRHSYTDEKRAALEAWGRYVTELVIGKPAKVIPIRGSRGR